MQLASGKLHRLVVLHSVAAVDSNILYAFYICLSQVSAVLVVVDSLFFVAPGQLLSYDLQKHKGRVQSQFNIERGPTLYLIGLAAVLFGRQPLQVVG